mgnify:FL=1
MPLKGVSIKNIKKLAFTLAEVLITLGIIGSIAALTLPGLIQNYKKSVAENELKKVYSLLNQVVLRSEADNGPAIYWDWEAYQNDGYKYNEFFNKYFAPYLQVTKTAQWTINPYYEYTAAGESVGYLIGRSNEKYLYLADGTVLAFSVDRYANHFGFFKIVLSSSSKKKKLIMGRDTFKMAISLKDKKAAVSVFPDNWQDWNCENILGKDKVNFFKACTEHGNNTTGMYPDAYCTMILYCNNWQVPEDYPIKF